MTGVFLFPLLLAFVPARDLDLRLTLKEWTGTPWPVRTGVPFARGALRDVGELELVAADGRRAPFEAKAAAFWPDGSIRWALLDWQAEQPSYRLRRSNAAAATPQTRCVTMQIEPRAIRMENEGLMISSEIDRPSLFVLERKGGRASLRGQLLWREGDREKVAGVQVLSDEWRGMRRSAFRAEGSEKDGEGSLSWRARVELSGSLPLLRVELALRNGGRRPREVEDVQFLMLSLADFRRRFGKEKGETEESSEGFFCVEAEEGVAFYLDRFRETHPKAFAVSPSGEIALGLLPGKSSIPPGGALVLNFRLYFHPKGWGRREHARLLPLLRGDLRPELAPKDLREAGALETAISAGGKRWESLLEEGLERLSSEMEQSDGWVDYGDHRLSRFRWAHLEYDTAAGLLRRYLRTGRLEWLRRAKDALSHWKSFDRLGPETPQTAWLPAVHGPEHGSGGGFELGHLWVEGLLLDYALTGDLSSREAAIDLGDALQKRVREIREGAGIERHYAWPVLALSELESFFPGRGYRESADLLAGLLLDRFRPEWGVFAMEGRRDVEAGIVEVNSWLSGGLLLEALVRYRQDGGRHEVGEAVAGLVEFLREQAWDPRRRRFFHTVVLEEPSGRVVERFGGLRPVWDLYLFAGIARAAREFERKDWEEFARGWERAAGELRWPKRHPGNDVSLFLRAAPVLF